ncbi:MAG: hypothetical protein ABSD46_02980 [Bacteroidota bacterium]
MLKNIFQKIRIALLKIKAKSLASATTQCFSKMLEILKDGEYVIAEQRKGVRDRQEYIDQNRDTQVDKNVARNTDNRRANILLSLTFVFESVFSFKGIQYLLDHFTGLSSLFVVLPAGLAFASFAIYSSITLNYFAKRYREENRIIFVFLTTVSYGLVFIIPACNMLEAYESNGGPGGSHYAIILNWVLVSITLAFHTALVTMSNIFITAKNSKVALAELAKIDNALIKADAKVHTLNASFLDAKNIFSTKAKNFVARFKELQSQDSGAAQQVLYLVDNFTIWMINKVMQHQLLPYHANEKGQPEVEFKYFDPINNSYVLAFDELSLVTRYNANGSQQPKENDTQQPSNTLASEAAPQNNELLPPEYDQTIDSQSNNNDKIL